MKNFISIILAGAITLLACSEVKDEAQPQNGATAEKLKKETGEALEATKEFAGQKRDAYREKLQSELKDLDDKITALRKKAEEKGILKIEKNEEALAELRKQKDQLLKKLDEVNTKGAPDWQDVKADLDSAMRNLKSSYEKIVSRLKK